MGRASRLCGKGKDITSAREVLVTHTYKASLPEGSELISKATSLSHVREKNARRGPGSSAAHGEEASARGNLTDGVVRVGVFAGSRTSSRDGTCPSCRRICERLCPIGQRGQGPPKGWDLLGLHRTEEPFVRRINITSLHFQGVVDRNTQRALRLLPLTPRLLLPPAGSWR